MDVRITRNNGEQCTLEEHGITVRDFAVSSVPLRTSYGEVEGRHGTVDYGATYDARTISVPFFYKAYDMTDFALLRDLLYKLIGGVESFYIEELRRDVFQTGDNKLVGGKRYKVRLQNTIDVDQTYQYGFGEMVFETTELPFAESVGTSQDIQRVGINVDDGLWGFGMGLIVDEDSLKYTHTSNTFRIYNAGNVAVHPFEQELKITISSVVGSGSYLELRNETNGTAFRVTEAVTVGQTVVLNGPNITINSLQALRKTNRKYIELAPGWNSFKLTGATSAKVEVDMRFYYL